jgi:hypothetical protein
MKASQRTQRRNARPAGPGVSLFPFLAVLICTMGALVPLLLAMSRTARLQAEAAAVAKLSQQGSEMQTQREDVRWRMEQLQVSRATTTSQLDDARLQLGHIEDHARRLRGQLDQYERTLADLEQLETVGSQRTVQSQAELEQLRAEVKKAEQQLAEARRTSTGRSRSYAVVPYEGPNQTRRRPIYLECRGDAIVLQPEGIVLGESDFEGPLGPGNPLAAALRAAREYLLAARNFDPQVGEPYPLLLVRPEGINAYYAARAAMKSWGFDFGYELVGDDWKLAYPPADARLADIVQQVIVSARASQSRLVAAAPREYERRPKVVYRAAASGGFVRESVAGRNEDSDYRPAGVSRAIGGNGDGEAYGGEAAYGGGGTAYGSEAAYGGAGGTETGSGSATMAGGDHGTGTGGGTMTGGRIMAGGGNKAPGSGMGADGNSDSRQGTPSDGVALAGHGSGGVSSAANGMGGLPAATGDGDSSLRAANGAASANRQPTERPDGHVLGQPPREAAGPTRLAASDERPPCGETPLAHPLRPGEWQPSLEPPPEKPKTTGKDQPHNDKHGKKSLAERRGVDWGLRDAARGSVGITRPIRVQCFADRLVILAERGSTTHRVIPLGPRTELAIDELISGVWEQMESWGMAGRGMYWRPLLRVDVAADAESRFLELSALLEGSGFLVQRR